MNGHLTCQGCGATFYGRSHLRDDRETLCVECMAAPMRPCHVCEGLFGPEGDEDLGLCLRCSDALHRLRREGNTTPTPHRESWAKVNVPVDEGAVEVVELLSMIPELETISSCQGDRGLNRGYVSFRYGDWKRTGAFLFEELQPALDTVGVPGRYELKVLETMGVIEFSPDLIPQITAALKSVLDARRPSEAMQPAAPPVALAEPPPDPKSN